MQFAANYSTALAGLLREQQVELDYFKCPAWPAEIAVARVLRPTYVHFPLRVGTGRGLAIDTGTGQPANWHAIEDLLARSDTPYLNLHLVPSATDHPHREPEAVGDADVDVITSCLLRDVQAVVSRFGSERVIVENDRDNPGSIMRAALVPEIIRTVVEETRCGLLLDLSHAQLAAAHLDIDPRAYIGRLPLANLRELHITGIQLFVDDWVARVRAAGIPERTVATLQGRMMDHLPMTDADWDVIVWALEHVRQGDWALPWAVAFEYGGVGPLWEAVTDRAVLETQIPRVYNLCKR